MKCPYCYRPINTHTHDPILLPNGAKYKFTDASETELEEVPNIEDRIYKGMYQVTELDITELQTELGTLETENGITPLTVFSPINSSGQFQITGQHIKEMRDSVEKLLTALGLTKTDYFNYDEDGNHIGHPLGNKIEWTDPITDATDLINFQIKYIHIEDLRHFIRLLWEETWTDNTPSWLINFNQTFVNVANVVYTESNNILADNDWGSCLYSREIDLSPLVGGNSGTMIVSNILDLHSQSFTVNSSIDFIATYFFQLRYILMNRFPGAALLMINPIAISNKPQLFWDGIFSGDISIPSFGLNYASFILYVERTDIFDFVELAITQFGSNSLNQMYPIDYSDKVILTDWTAQGISGINIYNELDSLGKDMSGNWVIKGIRFDFVNAKPTFFAGQNPYHLTSNLSVTLNNISIH